MATQRELFDPLGTAIDRGMTRTVPEAPKAAPIPYRADFVPRKTQEVNKPVSGELTPEDFDEPMAAKLSEVKAKWIPHNDAIEIVRALKDRGTIAQKTEEPKDDGKMASGTELIAGIGVEAPAFVGRTLAGISKLGSYINPMTYLSETQKARGEAGAQMVEDEGIRQSKAQEEAFKGIGIDTTSKMGEFGKGITKYGIPAAIPIGGWAAASTIKGLAAQGAKYGAAGGAIQSVTDQGADLTPWQLAKDTAIAGWAGAVINPVVWKVVAPAIGKVAEKAVKYGTALEKGGLQGLGMSVSRDYARKAVPKVADAMPAGGGMGKTVFGEDIEIPPPEKKWLYEGTMQKIASVGKGAEIGNLVGKSLGTKVRGTEADKLAKIGNDGQYVKDLETLHGMVRKGEIEWGSLWSLYEGAQALESGLQKIGKEIGADLKAAGLDSTVNVDNAIAKLDKIIGNSREAEMNPAMITLAQKFKNGLQKFNTLEDIQAIKQDFYQEISNLKKENAGREAFRDFMDAGAETIKAIEKKVEEAAGNAADFITRKAKYRALLNIRKDLVDSAVVSERRSPQGLIEQLADMRAGDFILDPVGAAKSKVIKDIGKAISERNSRDGAFRQAIEFFDKRALGRGGAAVPPVGKWPKAPTSAIPDDAWVNPESYAANLSEQTANKMASNAYKYVLESTQQGKATLDFRKLGEITSRLDDGQAGYAGKLGDVITDPKLREMYKNALNTPIEIVNEKGVAGSVGEFVTQWPKAGTIVLRSGNAETGYNLADTVLHEGAHALRHGKGRPMTNDYAPKVLPPKKSPKVLPPKNPLKGTIFDQSNKTGAFKIGFGKTEGAGVPRVGTGTDALTREARKFKSAEEFVKKEAIRKQLIEDWTKINPDDTVTLYHATYNKNDILKQWEFKWTRATPGWMTWVDLWDNVVYFWTDKDWVKRVWSSWWTRDILEIKVPLEYIRKASDNTLEVYIEWWLKKQWDKWIPWKKPQSTFYDRIAEKTLLSSKEKQQLIDIYNKANKK